MKRKVYLLIWIYGKILIERDLLLVVIVPLHSLEVSLISYKLKLLFFTNIYLNKNFLTFSAKSSVLHKFHEIIYILWISIWPINYRSEHLLSLFIYYKRKLIKKNEYINRIKLNRMLLGLFVCFIAEKKRITSANFFYRIKQADKFRSNPTSSEWSSNSALNWSIFRISISASA